MAGKPSTTTINGDDRGDRNGSSYQDTNVYDNEGNILPHLFGLRFDDTLQHLDMGAIKKNSYSKTREAMAAIHPTLAKKIIPLPNEMSREESAAVCIQAHFRGYLARKIFVQLLYDKYMKEHEEMEARRKQQVEEGELLVENYRLNVEVEENSFLRKNHRRGMECDVITIQRAWREYKRKSQNTWCPDSVGTYSGTFRIRTNPFTASSEDDLSDVFNDSLEQVTEENFRNTEKYGLRRSICDSEWNIESVSSQPELPSPTTDWESIESCLTSEGETQDLEHSEPIDSSSDRLKQFSLKPKDLQICFVDDTLLSDIEGDEDSCLIKEYIIDKQEISDEEKRDSGCVAGDDEMSESFSIKTVNPEALKSQDISQAETEKVLLELKKQDSDCGEKDEKYSIVMSGWTERRLNELTVAELRELEKNMAQLIEAQNEVLVTELMTRDSLHLKQDSLLMEVEDASKLAQAQYQVTQKGRKSS
ncbi:uncharacterized protein LOC114963013 isoform X1 [Acropora millepora]|uniref:uncharacterized protein LOC114963013 isoform X1 n=1 Tax=Acropora millepora TaxID=45264 RepID=UPI001CF4F9BC|nr:uncharacterized protein LOC114963013 isoform X1 [Acropora millepora]